MAAFAADAGIKHKSGGGSPSRRAAVRPKGSADGLVQLYEISKFLSQFQGVEKAMPAILRLVCQVVPICGAALMERTEERPRMFIWHAPMIGATRLQFSLKRALDEYNYFTGSGALPDGPELIEKTMEEFSCSDCSEHDDSDRVALPLILSGSPAFGVFQVEGESAIDKAGVEFISAVVSQIAVALDRHNARLNESALKETLERRIAWRTEQLEQKINELNTFSYSIAHDLRAPLRTMSGFAQNLLQNHAQSLDPAAREYLDRIIGGSQRMDALIRDLLDFSRVTLSDIVIVPIALSSILPQVLDGLEGEIHDRKVHISVEGALPSVVGNALMLAQVLGNLISNAVKFTESGVEPRISISAEWRGEWTRVWIEDNGIGIAPEHHERIFKIFERLNARDSRPGTGIGLAIARKAVERMGGRIGVESASGSGSRFWFELRTVEENA